MILVGLTGGIGSGKSTVSAMFAARGAEIVDADMITRDVQQPGSPIMEEIAERFGSEVVDSTARSATGKLAEMVFADADALARPQRDRPSCRRRRDRPPGRPSDVDRQDRRARHPPAHREPAEGSAGKDRRRRSARGAGRAAGALPRFRRGRRPGADRAAGQPRGAVEGRRLRDRQQRCDRRISSRRSNELWQWLSALPQLPADFDFQSR